MEVVCPRCKKKFPLKRLEGSLHGACQCGFKVLLSKRTRKLDQSLGGTRLANYKLMQPLWGEATGTLFKALHFGLNRSSVIKVFNPALTEESWLVKRFLEEAQLGSKVYSPYVARVVDLQKVEHLFYCLDFHEGMSLAASVKKEAKIDIRSVVRRLLRIARAVRKVHAEGLVHLGVSPWAIRLSRTGEPLLCDFSFICRPSEQTQMTLGQPGYIAPEVLAGEGFDHKADLYSFGMTMYHALSGRPPLERKGAILEPAVPRIELMAANPEVPQVIASFVDQLISFSPDKRPETAEDVVKFLRGWLKPPALTVPSAPAPVASPPAPSPGTSSFTAAQKEFPLGLAEEEPRTAATENPSLPQTVVETATPTKPQTTGTAPPGKRMVSLKAIAITEGVLVLILAAGLTYFATKAPPPPPQPKSTSALSTTSVAAVTTVNAQNPIYMDPKEAEESLQAAFEYEQKNPDDFKIIIAKYEEIIIKFPNSLSARKATEYKASTEKRFDAALQKEINALSDTIQAAVKDRAYGKAVEACNDLAGRLHEEKIKLYCQQQVAELQKRAASEFDLIARASAGAADRRSFTEAIALYQPVIERWGLDNLKEKAQAAVATLRKQRSVYITTEYGEALREVESQLANYEFDNAITILEEAVKKTAEPALRDLLETKATAMAYLSDARKAVFKYLRSSPEKLHQIRLRGGQFGTHITDVDAQGFMAKELNRRVTWKELGPAQYYNFSLDALPRSKTRHFQLGLFCLHYGVLADAFKEFDAAISEDPAMVEKIAKFIRPGGAGLCYVEAGDFVLGDDAFPDRSPRQVIQLDAYLIGRYEVTRWEYAFFARVTNRSGPRVGRGAGGETMTLPVVEVSWDDARACAQWLAGDLPSEFEWEKAARGTDGRKSLWPEPFSTSYANLLPPDAKPALKEQASLKPVGSYRKIESPYGCLDVLGNAAEWTADWYKPYPAGKGSNDLTGKERCIRGGSFRSNSKDVALTSRDHKPPTFRSDEIGFRVAWKYME